MLGERGIGGRTVRVLGGGGNLVRRLGVGRQPAPHFGIGRRISGPTGQRGIGGRLVGSCVDRWVVNLGCAR